MLALSFNKVNTEKYHFIHFLTGLKVLIIGKKKFISHFNEYKLHKNSLLTGLYFLYNYSLIECLTDHK